MTHLALALAYIGSAIGVAMVLPQLLRIVRNPGMGGVSPWTWAITAVACTTWMAYGVRTGSLPQIPGNVLLVSGAVAVVLLVPSTWSRRCRAVGLLSVMCLAALLSTRLSAEAVGFVAFAVGLVGLWPQVFETVWLRRGMGPSAISLTSSGMKIGSQLCWLSFAVMTSDVPVIVSALMAMTANTVVTSVETSRRRADVGPVPIDLGGRVPATAGMLR